MDLFTNHKAPVGHGNALPVADLVCLLRYEPESGKLFWRPREGDDRFTKTWNARYSGREAFTRIINSGYRIGTIFSKPYLAHRVIWAMTKGYWPRECIDHINGDKLDNRLSNLREVSKSGNGRNQKLPVTNKSGVIGVCWDRFKGKWKASAQVEGRSLHLGYFHLIDDAIAARQQANDRYGFHPNHGR